MNATTMTTMDGLPKQFLSSLRILFDILDENRTGFIRLRDIESRWNDDDVRGLPAGIVEGLRKVTPSNGLLSFEKFVSGLKIVLNSRGPRIENEPRKQFLPRDNYAPLTLDKDKSSLENKQRPVSHRQFVESYEYRQQPPPYSNDNRRVFANRHQSDSHANVDDHRTRQINSPVNDNITLNGYTIKSDVSDYPNSSGPSRQNQNLHFYNGRRVSQSNPHQHDKAPAIPPRTITNRSSSYLKKSQSGPDLHHPQSPPAVPPRENNPNSRIISDLRNWQREWTTNQTQSRPSDHGRYELRNQTSAQDRDAIYANIDQFQKKRDIPPNQANVAPQKATVRRHGSGRRHTLTSGIDQNVMKRMKQLDDETSMLKAGLSMLDSARDWYMKQLSIVADKQAMLGKVSYNDNSLESHQERMNFQRARISEVNQQLKTLLESSEKGFPLHMNLAMSNRTPAVAPRDKSSQLAVLMERNRKLMDEMSQKNEQMSQLEKEKASLVRDLFETRSKNKSVSDDTTFM